MAGFPASTQLREGPAVLRLRLILGVDIVPRPSGIRSDQPPTPTPGVLLANWCGPWTEFYCLRSCLA